MKESWLKLKTWWAQLALRERQMIVFGGSLLSIFLVYQLLLRPYLNYVNEMRQRILTEQKTLIWMQATDKAINQITNQTKNKTTPSSPVLMLSIMQKHISLAGLERYLTQLKQNTNESIEVHFQKVEFDRLIRLLTVLINEQHFTVLQISVVAENAPGIVNADVILKS